MKPDRPYGIWIGVLACLMGLALAGGCGTAVSDRTIREITPAEAADRLAKSPKSVVAVDAREGEAYAEGHLPGAVRLPLASMGEQERAPAELRGKSLVIVYGADPASSSAIALTKRLMSLGVKDVRLMRAGFLGWRSQSLPVETFDDR